MNVMRTETIVIVMPNVPIQMDRIRVPASRDIVEMVSRVTVCV